MGNITGVSGRETIGNTEEWRMEFLHGWGQRSDS